MEDYYNNSNLSHTTQRLNNPKRECFAYNNGSCSATTRCDCNNCRFYKTEHEYAYQKQLAHTRAVGLGIYSGEHDDNYRPFRDKKITHRHSKINMVSYNEKHHHLLNAAVERVEQ